VSKMSCGDDEMSYFINNAYLDILDLVGETQADGDGVCLDCAFQEIFALSASYLRQTGHTKADLVNMLKLIDQFPEAQPDWAGLETCH